MSDHGVDVVIVCAMEKEAKPFLDALESPSALRTLPSRYRGPATFHDGHLHGLATVVVTSGIGTTNAAIATTTVLAHHKPRLVIIAGTAGGLGAGVELDQVMLATSTLYHDADATTFGYVVGQIPRMPPVYEANVEALEIAEKAVLQAGLDVRKGPISSGNSFVMADRVDAIRHSFPQAIAADMETAAVAQVCWSFDCPWISLRAVSDMCTSSGEFAERAPKAYETSFQAASAVMKSLSELSS